jgi:hypothetical protein
VSEGMSAAAVVAHAVAAMTAAMVEQARIARPWGEAIRQLEHRTRPGTNTDERIPHVLCRWSHHL